MNLKVKKIIMSVAIIGALLSAGTITTSANSITKYGHKEAWAAPTTNVTFAWTGSTGGYVYAQSYKILYSTGLGAESTGAVGYNSWVQTPQVRYSSYSFYIQGRHWSDNEYRVS